MLSLWRHAKQRRHARRVISRMCAQADVALARQGLRRWHNEARHMRLLEMASGHERGVSLVRAFVQWRSKARHRMAVRHTLVKCFGALVRGQLPSCVCFVCGVTCSRLALLVQVPAMQSREAFRKWKYMTRYAPKRRGRGSIWIGSSVYYALKNEPLRRAWRTWITFVLWQRGSKVCYNYIPCWNLQQLAPHAVLRLPPSIAAWSELALHWSAPLMWLRMLA